MARAGDVIVITTSSWIAAARINPCSAHGCATCARCRKAASPASISHYTMLQRNLLYTGVTRGKQLVVLVGQPKAVAIAVRNVSSRRRYSKLNEWLRGSCTG